MVILRRQYLSESKLSVLGFKKRKNWFVLEKERWNKVSRRLECKEVGKVRLDDEGFVVDSRGFEKMNGKLVFIQTPAFW